MGGYDDWLAAPYDDVPDDWCGECEEDECRCEEIAREEAEIAADEYRKEQRENDWADALDRYERNLP